MSEMLGFEKWANAALSVAGTNGMSDDQVIPTWPEGIDGPPLTIGMVKAALGGNGGEAVPVGYVSRGFAEGEFPPLGKISRSRGPERVGTGGPKFEIAVYTHTAPPSVAVPDDDLSHAAQFLLDRLADWGTEYIQEEGMRDWMGHVEHAIARLRSALAPAPDHTGDANKMVEPFQTRVSGWMQECFGPEISADKVERNHRFLEEALELVQALGCTKEEASQLVDYVYGRAVGDPPQEVGGVMVTLAALCLASGMDMDAAAETELARILHPEMVTKIRKKQKRKPAFSPLPGSYPERKPAQDAGRQVKPHRTGKSSGPFIPESGAGIIATEDPIARLRNTAGDGEQP